MICFSAFHLHASGMGGKRETRFSIEVRSIHIDDCLERNGPRNIDGLNSGSSISDFSIDHIKKRPLPDLSFQKYFWKNGQDYI